METIARTFIIPFRQNLFGKESIFINSPIRRIAVAKNTKSAVTGSFHENHLNDQQFHLRELKVIRGGRAIVSLDTTSPCRPYVTTLRAMQLNEDFPARPMEVLQITIFVFLLLLQCRMQLNNCIIQNLEEKTSV